MEMRKLIDVMNKEVPRYESGIRRQRASFLVWFLINFFKLDEDSALDSICDSPNDKGIDGIYVDDVNEEIYIFQSKYSPKPGSAQGDNDLRNFVGASSWFKSKENIALLDDSFASNELKSLVKKLDVFDRVEKQYDLFTVFVTNKIFDDNGNDYLKAVDEFFDAWDLNRLFSEYIYTGKDLPIIADHEFPFDESNAIRGIIDGSYEYFMFPVKVKDLVRLEGIQDKTLFSKNVRYSLGRTRVNRDIKKTIRSEEEHNKVVLYHNGVTLVCDKVSLEDSKLKIANYSIVNGCQSTVTFYENKNYLSDNLVVLLKIIETGGEEEFAKRITYFANNQNSISLQDLKSNDKVQQDLQEEFLRLFDNKILYRIKKGEDEKKFDVVLPNDFAAQLITAFYLKEPHITHQKSKIFADNYNNIFNRHINAAYIFALYCMFIGIENNIDKIENEGVRSYKTTKFFFIYVFRLILEQDAIGNQLLNTPSEFVANYLDDLIGKFGKLFNMVVHDFNYQVKESMDQEAYFDYKNELRNQRKVKEMAEKILVDYKKSISRHPEDAFAEIISVAM